MPHVKRTSLSLGVECTCPSSSPVAYSLSAHAPRWQKRRADKHAHSTSGKASKLRRSRRTKRSAPLLTTAPIAPPLMDVSQQTTAFPAAIAPQVVPSHQPIPVGTYPPGTMCALPLTQPVYDVGTLAPDTQPHRTSAEFLPPAVAYDVHTHAASAQSHPSKARSFLPPPQEHLAYAADTFMPSASDFHPTTAAYNVHTRSSHQDFPPADTVFPRAPSTARYDASMYTVGAPFSPPAPTAHNGGTLTPPTACPGTTPVVQYDTDMYATNAELPRDANLVPSSGVNLYVKNLPATANESYLVGGRCCLCGRGSEYTMMVCVCRCVVRTKAKNALGNRRGRWSGRWSERKTEMRRRIESIVCKMD
jgi:hypothetical protein